MQGRGASKHTSQLKASSPLQRSISLSKNAPVTVTGQQHGSSKPVSPQARSLNVGSAPVARMEPVRELPSRNISDDSIEDAYVQFIFYCNPYLPLSSDTTELRRGFQSMPRTDGRTFAPFVLFKLIEKLETREIETWGQLVVEMGVKPPDVSSGQSTQKVQQYAVRLKRWLHAYHIDAFFQYCLDKSNPYFTEIPVVDEITEATIRDGVPPEDDLALRALVPKWRPKRGRKPLDDGSDASPNAKRQLRASSLTVDEQRDSALPLSAYPQSAFPWDRQSNSSDAWLNTGLNIEPRSKQGQGGKHYQQQPSSKLPPAPASTTSNVPQAANGATPSIEQQLSFYVDGPNPNDDSESTFPQSAVHAPLPTSAFPRNTTPTPQSAHPGSPASARRGRKRHGGVSAAWTPDAGSGKVPRGRPPANRISQDGLYATFPAKSAAGTPITPASAQPMPQSSTASPRQLLQSATADASAYTPSTSTSVTATSSPYYASTLTKKPSKLQLQVPQHEGGPVRLATPPAQAQPPQPPPRVLIHSGPGGSAGQHVSLSRGARELSAVDDEDLDGLERGSEEAELAMEAEAMMGDIAEDGPDGIDWKRRAILLRRKVRELEAELKNMKRRVMEAVM